MRFLKLSVVLLSFLVFCKEFPSETEVYFSPEGGAEDAVLSCIMNAEKEICIAMYSFTNRRIAQALVDAKDKGVKVRVLLEKANTDDPFSKAKFLSSNGVEVKVYSSPFGGIMHHKFAVYDERVITTGSFNWTSYAEHKNFEDLLVIKSKQIAKTYKKRFEWMWKNKNTRYIDEEELYTFEVIDAKNLEALKRASGKWCIVKGRVESVGYSRRSNTYFLNFGKRGECFTVVIFSRVVNRFKKYGIDIDNFEGKIVEVEGKVIDHPKYGLEILLDSPENIKEVAE